MFVKCFLAVFPAQKLIFGHFWNWKKWNLVKKNYLWNWFIRFHEFFGLDLFKFFLAHWVFESGFVNFENIHIWLDSHSELDFYVAFGLEKPRIGQKGWCFCQLQQEAIFWQLSKAFFVPQSNHSELFFDFWSYL